MSSEKELTPEERLLALIQQDTRQGAAAPGSASTPAQTTPKVIPPTEPSTVAPAPSPAPVPAVVTAPVAQSREERAPIPVAPPPVAAAPAERGAVPTAVPEGAALKKANAGEARGAPAVVAVAPGAKKEEAADADRKLKLAATPAAAAAPAPAAAPARSAPLAPPTAAVASGPAVAAAAPPAAPPSPAPRRSKPVRAPGIPSVGWPLANRVLALVVLVLLVLVVYSIASIQSGIEADLVRQVNEAGELAAVPVGDAPLKAPELDGILQKVQVRDIFQPLEVTGTTTNSPGGEKKTDFKLVGVSIDTKTPEATMAILRNKTSSQTFFVKVGEALGDTGYTLGRVLADHVILKKQKQEIEVR